MYILKSRLTVLIICFIVAATAAIYHFTKDKPITEQEEKSLSICTSIYPIYDFTRSVCGESDDVFCIVPKGSDFRTWQPTDADIEKMCSADMFIFSGKGAEPWLNDLFPVLSSHGVKLVNTSKDITEESPTGYIWLNPKNALIQMTEIYNFIKAENPQNETVYKMNMDIFTEKFQKLDAMIKDELSVFVNKNIYVASPVYDSFCAAYGLTQSPVWDIDTQGNFLSEQANNILAFVNKHNIHAIYIEPQNNAYALKELLNSAKAFVLELDPFVINLTDDNYFNVMEKNILSLKKGQMPSQQ